MLRTDVSQGIVGVPQSFYPPSTLCSKYCQPISQMRSLRHREAKKIEPRFKPRQCDSEFILLTLYLLEIF